MIVPKSNYMKKDLQLNSRLARYTAVTASVAAVSGLVNEADAQVMYTDISPDQVLSTEGSAVSIDFNGDQVVDFYIYMMNAGTQTGTYNSAVYTLNFRGLVVDDPNKNNNFIAVQDNLSAISINLPEENSKIAGLYYHFFKRLAWEGIILYEVVSTTNEFTILVEDNFVDKAFSAIKKLKR